MKFCKGWMLQALIIYVIISILTTEIEARRKILRGRKTVTRRYYTHNTIPAWAIVCLVSLGMLLIGGILYVVMNKMIIAPPLQQPFAPVTQNEP